MKYRMIIPDSYCEATPEDRKATCNGMGPAGRGWTVPDTMLGLSVTLAGDLHDWMCDGRDESILIDLPLTHETAALAMLWNTVALIMAGEGRGLRGRIATRWRVARAAWYFVFVWWCGRKHFKAFSHGGGVTPSLPSSPTPPPCPNPPVGD
jgi:hypothetical protein